MNHNISRTGALTRWASTPRIHDFVLRHLAFVDGLENIPRTGPLVLVANHSSYMDHFVTKTLVESVRGGRVWFPTKAEAFEKPLSRAWHESMNCYPVDRNAPSEEVFMRAKEVLAADDTLVLYPEGTRNTESGLLPFKSGAFRMALAGKAPVVPVGMVGVADVLPKGAAIPRNRLLSVAVGTPLAADTSGDIREVARAQRNEAFCVITELKKHAAQATATDHGAALDNLVLLAEKMAKENMTADGRLSKDVVRRINLLLRLADVSSKRRLDLKLQRTRLQGFEALNARTQVEQIARATLVNRQAQSLSDLHAGSDFSAYLAGRSSLILPELLGGGAKRASTHFQRAIDREGPMKSQAYVGLAEAYAALGLNDLAIAAYSDARKSIDVDDPRGPRRHEKIQMAVTKLASSSARNG